MKVKKILQKLKGILSLESTVGTQSSERRGRVSGEGQDVKVGSLIGKWQPKGGKDG